MADIHVLEGDGRDKWRLIFHYPVPDVLNEIGVNYQDAIVHSSFGGSSSMTEGVETGQISAAEVALIVAGELFEHSVSFRAESGATNNAELIAAVKAEYTKHQASVTADMKKRLRYLGWEGSAV